MTLYNASLSLHNAICMARINALSHTPHSNILYSVLWVTAEGKFQSMGMTTSDVVDSMTTGCIWRAVWKRGVRIS